MFFSVSLFLLLILRLGSTADISVRIERHFPCSASSGPKKENLLIKFPSYKTPGVQFHEETNDLGHKCFRMSGGNVEDCRESNDVNRVKTLAGQENLVRAHKKEIQVYGRGLSGDKKYYVHLETRIGIHGKPERCVNADANGCGGIGSCVHCDICHQKGGALKNFVQIFKGNKPAECSKQGLLPGSYEDLSLRVCLPTKNELLPFLDQNASRAEQLWDLFVSSRARSGEIPLVIAARIFDRPINQLSPKEMNELLHESKDGLVACHWIYATVSQPSAH